MRQTSSKFQFREFCVDDDRCAMKVGTDGILLGAWTSAHPAVRKLKPRSILDVGCGCGLISLMLASQYPHAQVTAIDIDAHATFQAADNFRRSRWASCFHAKSMSLSQFAISEQRGTIDLVVSNPPYFSAGTLPPAVNRRLARHQQAMTMQSLLADTASLANSCSLLSLVLPSFDEDRLMVDAAENAWHVETVTEVRSFPHRLPHRILILLSRTEVTISRQELVIYQAPGRYSRAFWELTNAYYLDSTPAKPVDS
ncbi:MAG TPA: methyltransferase [Pirellulaceae bacterium]|nr:methyltransferase [Pirellulaceae bacterium]HMO92355.1 methyltransferase [Pirellulaceae bacterium]HMP69279.1 methyltransferase [Pirellulaceae bacterium]